MLAPNWKTAEELGITEDQRLALISTLGALERGECVPFHMAGWCNCIHGHTLKAAEKLGVDASKLSMMGTPLLSPLFIPDANVMTEVRRDYDSITQDEAAQALRNTLVEGKPHWGSVLEPA